VYDAVLDIRGFRGPGNGETATTGFHATVSMALACRSVHLYGFQGSTTFDGHAMDASHGIEREHVLLRELAAHAPLTGVQMPHVLRDVWPAANLAIVC
jgi:hypothetical protein